MMTNPLYACGVTSGQLGEHSCIAESQATHYAYAFNEPIAAGHQHTIYYFMCRFTCSRCWRTALELARYHEALLDRNITVVLVGQGPYLRQATCLAAGLRLPFHLIVDDRGVLRRRFDDGSEDGNSHRQSIVLVDSQGSVRYRQRVSLPGGRLRLASLMVVAFTLPKTGDEEKAAAGRTFTGCV